uniref:Uncharacterized protein n=1 Tax=Kalanchoe fedtschenkoi TaxID=63787 RepID=A0A7N0VEI9_KALFE
MAAQMLIAHSSLLHLQTHRRPSPPFRPLKVNASMSTSLYPIGVPASTWTGELGYWKGIPAVVSSSEAPVAFSEPGEGLDLKSALDVEFGGGDDGGSKGGKGYGGGGGGGNEGEGGEEEDAEAAKKTGMSMSQKLTLGYAALVGFGGLMGYLKSGSLKSLAAAGISASILFFVYTQLPVRPALASAVGLGLSAALLVVMGSRFKKSGKVFPAGIVSLVSFIMTGGYFHGIMRGH